MILFCALKFYMTCAQILLLFYNEQMCFVKLRKLQNGVHRDLHRLSINKADLLYLLSSCEFNYVVMITILNNRICSNHITNPSGRKNNIA